MTGQNFGKLTVIGRTERPPNRGLNKGAAWWVCKCSCGKEVVTTTNQLKRGKTTSCGCKRVESNTVHGDGVHKDRNRLYQIWSDMKSRCSNPKIKAYKHYGGRGISVCEEWSDWLGFKDWAIKNGYTEDLTIDRIDVDGNYEPSNCRWATWKEQANNKRTNKSYRAKSLRQDMAVTEVA